MATIENNFIEETVIMSEKKELKKDTALTQAVINKEQVLDKMGSADLQRVDFNLLSDQTCSEISKDFDLVGKIARADAESVSIILQKADSWYQRPLTLGERKAKKLQVLNDTISDKAEVEKAQKAIHAVFKDAMVKVRQTKQKTYDGREVPLDQVIFDYGQKATYDKENDRYRYSPSVNMSLGQFLDKMKTIKHGEMKTTFKVIRAFGINKKAAGIS